MSISALPSFKKETNFLSCDALHFVDGNQEIRILDLEWSIPLHSIKFKNDQGEMIDAPDVQRVIDLIKSTVELLNEWRNGKGKGYEGREMYPQLLPLEFRIIKGNNNRHFTTGYKLDYVLTIEVLTLKGTHAGNPNIIHDEKTNRPDSDQVFYDYCQELTNRWANVVGHDDVKYMRPHWGKIWAPLTINGKDMYQHLRETYAESIAAFRPYMDKHDPNHLFFNHSFEKLFQI